MLCERLPGNADEDVVHLNTKHLQPPNKHGPSIQALLYMEYFLLGGRGCSTSGGRDYMPGPSNVVPL